MRRLQLGMREMKIPGHGLHHDAPPAPPPLAERAAATVEEPATPPAPPEHRAAAELGSPAEQEEEVGREGDARCSRPPKLAGGVAGRYGEADVRRG